MHLALKLLLALVPKDKAIHILLAGILLPVFLICVLFSGPVVVHERVPMVSQEQAMLYFNAAKRVSNSTSSPCDKGVIVNWQQVIAIDAVLLNQDFSNANEDRAYQLARRFVEKIGECTHCQGTGEKRTCSTYPVYRLKTIDEVMDELGFSQEEKERVMQFLAADLSFLLNISGVPPGWVPQTGPWAWPVPGNYSISSGFGPRIDPFTGDVGKHDGIDIPDVIGTRAVAARKGVVVHCSWSSGYGNLVELDHGDGIHTLYGHLSAYSVIKGQVVEMGQEIGRIGSSGKSTGPHLHFEVRVNGVPVNPLTFYGGS
ncbi:metalloendopeptidases [Desulfocucumis palustris]|uniref:Metalloendopeptidases n=1 Tax=Desulfocucumis palustris TaxID=1898651 RepID=A0A2L2XGP9_9FIRM|nr:M23 family metallopeptidase [Desulfocucumis palustris]GBF35408.1 metalloendopeptidases [Desulfocucumis palustris]